jgi:hypothetical protein|tara:strand:- start:3639 stop:3851 length:213 start_codon:yes stop_codon:yes gene_type:complete
MNKIVEHFRKITAIIRSDCNCLQHRPTLHRLIENFYKFHIKDDRIENEKEVGILTYTLHQELKERYHGLE